MSTERDVVRLEARGDPDAMTRLRQRLGQHGAHLRVRQTGRITSIEVDAEHIEAVGSALEAAASEAGAEVRLTDLNAVVAPAALEGRPSGVWAAIGDAAFRRSLARERGEEQAVDLYKYVAIVESWPARFAIDRRPPRVDPSDLAPRYDEELQSKLDDADWHAHDAKSSGQPEVQAWAHMALFVTWLIRRDLVVTGLLPAEDLAAVKGGEIAGEGVMDAIDYRLLTEMLSDEGSAFARVHYADFLREFERTFADEPAYSVRADAAAYARVEPNLDGLWELWRRGRAG